jgi:hypothetical protein
VESGAITAAVLLVCLTLKKKTVSSFEMLCILHPVTASHARHLNALNFFVKTILIG